MRIVTIFRKSVFFIYLFFGFTKRLISPFFRVLSQDPTRGPRGAIASTEVGKYASFFQLPIGKRTRFPNSMLSPFPHHIDLGSVCLCVTRFAEKPGEQDGVDADCGQLLHPGHGVWQPDLLSSDREGHSACA